MFKQSLWFRLLIGGVCALLLATISLLALRQEILATISFVFLVGALLLTLITAISRSLIINRENNRTYSVTPRISIGYLFGLNHHVEEKPTQDSDQLKPFDSKDSDTFLESK